MSEGEPPLFDPFPQFKELSLVTQQFLLTWCMSPLTAEELLADEPERETIKQELARYDVLLLE